MSMKTKGRVSKARNESGILLIIKEILARSRNLVEKKRVIGAWKKQKAEGSKQQAVGRKKRPIQNLKSKIQNCLNPQPYLLG